MSNYLTRGAFLEDRLSYTPEYYEALREMLSRGSYPGNYTRPTRPTRHVIFRKFDTPKVVTLNQFFDLLPRQPLVEPSGIFGINTDPLSNDVLDPVIFAYIDEYMDFIMLRMTCKRLYYGLPKPYNINYGSHSETRSEATPKTFDDRINEDLKRYDISAELKKVQDSIPPPRPSRPQRRSWRDGLDNDDTDSDDDLMWDMDNYDDVPQRVFHLRDVINNIGTMFLLRILYDIPYPKVNTTNLCNLEGLSKSTELIVWKPKWKDIGFWNREEPFQFPRFVRSCLSYSISDPIKFHDSIGFTDIDFNTLEYSTNTQCDRYNHTIYHHRTLLEEKKNNWLHMQVSDSLTYKYGLYEGKLIVKNQNHLATRTINLTFEYVNSRIRSKWYDITSDGRKDLRKEMGLGNYFNLDHVIDLVTLPIRRFITMLQNKYNINTTCMDQNIYYVIEWIVYKLTEDIPYDEDDIFVDPEEYCMICQKEEREYCLCNESNIEYDRHEHWRGHRDWSKLMIAENKHESIIQAEELDIKCQEVDFDYHNDRSLV